MGYGPGPRSEPHAGPGRRREVPFGPEISWPNGFRPLDRELRDGLESEYGTGPVYRQPAVDDYGYGDPGYSDPSYDGPRTPHGSAPVAYGSSPAPYARSSGFRSSGLWSPDLLPSGADGPGPQGAGPQRSGWQGAGPQRSGWQGSGPQRSGWQGAGPQGAGPQRSGRQGAGLRRSGPRGFGVQGLGSGHPSGPQRLVEPHSPGGAPSSPQAPGRAVGYGPPRGGDAPQRSVGRLDPGAFPGAPAGPGGVGVLTPLGGSRLLADSGTLPAAAERPGTVTPGHGLDGPEITASWPAEPSPDELDAYDRFWRDDDEDCEYSGLFEEPEAKPARPAAAKRRTGRRRGRSNDHRLWLGLGGVVVLAAAAIAGILKFEFPSHGGPAHTMITPVRVGTYMRTVDLEHQADVAQLRADVIRMSAGKASHVVSAVYESGNSAAGGTEQIIMFIGGHLANADPAASVAGFTQRFPGSTVVSAGSLGGRAACVETGNNVALCAWFDNDSFGELVSPTMNARTLAGTLRTVRPSVEAVAGK